MVHSFHQGHRPRHRPTADVLLALLVVVVWAITGPIYQEIARKARNETAKRA